MTLLVQKYLETHTLSELKADHGVNSRVAGHKMSLNYDMLEASNTDPLACQCRGVVLNHNKDNLDENTIVGETYVFARTMDRFFNHGQDCAADVDFEAKGTKFYEKLDGTHCALYHDDFHKEWCISTRSLPNADLPIDGFGDLTFRGLFEKAVKETTGHDFDNWVEKENLFPHMTYIFELCTPANRVVVEHSDYKVTSLAIRNRNGSEVWIDDDNYKLWLVPACPTYDLSNLAEMIDFVSSRDPVEHEGVVAVDKNFNRVKVKNAGYLALHRVKDSAMRSPRALVELCLLGKLDDALPLLPEHIVQRAKSIEEGLRVFIKNSDKSYMNVASLATAMCDEKGWNLEDHGVFQKAMALSAQQLGAWLPFIMMQFQGQVHSFGDFVRKQIDPKTGQYKKSFLDTLLNKIE